MTQQLSPWLEGAYGWDFGEGGWNSGMDQNLLKFSFMFDRNVDSIVSSLPPALNGQAHYLTTDNRIYFVVNNTYYSSPVPKWFEFKVKSTGQTYQFNGTSAVVINSPADIDTRLDAVELTVSSLGSAAFEDVGAFATSTELDLVEAQAQSYTDTYKTDVANSADISKGAALIGYAGTTVRNTLVSHGATITDNSSNISRLNAVQSNNAPLYFKSKVLEVGFRDATYDSLVATYGYDYLYPQSFAIDTAANELWVLRAANTGANNWPWIWVYDLTTGVRKTTFTTGQQWRETLIIRYAGTFGTDRYVYTIGNSNSVIRMLLNTLPANLSTATIANTYAVDAQSQMAWDGTNWYVQDSKALQGLSARNRFTIRNPSMALQTGQVTLPFDTLGTLQAYTDSFPKSQGICFHQGSIYVANGGPYDPANPAHVAANNNGIYLQGIQSVSPQGEKERTALSHPADYIANMSTLLGYTATVCETEGVYSAGGNLYSLQITLGPTDRVNPVNAGKGVVIIKELSTDANRVSFLSGARALPTPFNPLDFQARCWHSSGQLTNPVTGAAITTFSGIVAMMRELGLSTYLFGGTNQVITDLNGVVVDTTGRLIRCTNINGSSFSIECIGATTINPTYFLGTNGTVQFGPFYGNAEYGSNANGEYIKHANGVLECWYNDAAAQATTSLVASTAVANSIYQSAANITWTFPEPFVGADPEVTISIKANTSVSQVAWATQRNTGSPLTVAVFRIASPYNTASDVGQWRARAIGRWK